MHIYVPVFGKGGVVMGYRSDVMMVIQGKRLEDVMALMDAAGLHLEDHWGDQEYGLVNDTFIFYAEDVKWYTMSKPYFAEVDMIERMWEFARDIEEQWPGTLDGRFIRIGENDDDAEDRSFGEDPWELGRVERRIDMPYASLLGQNNRETKRDRHEVQYEKGPIPAA
jgi:hypothetical protein